MFDDDDDESDTQNRYPSIPSLVALQMMKNRLQLANLGKKLMKWSSMATGKELRKRAGEMNREFQNYGDQVANAYLLLARARFYNPDINKIVLQNVGHNAACVVEFENRTLIGVRFFHMILIERNHDPNLHLGLEKGGEAIAAAKQAWRELLREMILMLEYETAFQRIYVANKSATKKSNVLGKVIIPKIVNAIAYIKAELEEKEREETFRLKRFKYSKAKKVEREERVRKSRKSFQEPETIIEEPEMIEEPEKIKEPKITEEPEIITEPELFGETEKIEPEVRMLQIKTSKQKVIEPEAVVLRTVVPEDIASEIVVSDVMLSDIIFPELKVAEIMPEMKQEPHIILPEFVIQDEPVEQQKTLMKEIIFEGKPCKVAKDWDQFVKTPLYKDISETASTKQPRKSVESCPLCTAQTNDTNQRILHLIEHVNQFLMLCKQNKVDFTKLESKGDKFNYKNIKKELELVSFNSCPHKSSEERNKGDIGKISCLIQRPDGSYIYDHSKRTRGMEQECIYKCLTPRSSPMLASAAACKRTQIDGITSNGSVTTFFSSLSLRSKSMANAKYFEYCNWTPELTLQYEKNQNHIYPSTSRRRDKDNNGTQTSTHLCRCPSGEYSLSVEENQFPKPSNNSPYFKKSSTYYTSMPKTHYSSLNRNIKPYLSNSSNTKYFNLLPYIAPVTFNAPESRSGFCSISDMIYTSDWTNVIVPKEVATTAYQPRNHFSFYGKDLFDPYDIMKTFNSDTFNTVESSNTVIRNDSLTCMTVLPQGYPGVVPYMSILGFTDVINNNPLKQYAKVYNRQYWKGLVPYTPERRPGTSGLSNGVSSLLFIPNDSTSCSSDDSGSISGISDSEINEDCIACVVSQKDQNLEIYAQNENADENNQSQLNAESTNELGDKLKDKNYPVYVILTPDQNWPFNSYMKEKTLKRNAKNYQLEAGYRKQGSSSKTTRSSGTCKRKDFSVYVSLTPSQNSRFKPSRRELRPGTSNKYDAANTTGTATYVDNATYVTTVRRKSKSGTSCTRCGKCVTSYITCSESTDPMIKSKSGLNGVFDVRNATTPETVTYPAPYTREGRPGPSDVSNAQFKHLPYNRVPLEINITNSRLMTFSSPFTREGKPGPFGIYETSNITTSPQIEPVPYTREGRPGSFDISSAPYTREGRPGPYEMSKFKNNTTKPLANSVPYSREGRLPNDISKTCNSLTTTTFSTPKYQECRPDRCGVYSVVCVYTSEGTPRHCGLMEVCKNSCLKPCTSSSERKCGHFNSSEKSNIAACNPVTPCLPYTQESGSGPNGIASTTHACCKPNTQVCGPGRYGVYDVVSVYTSEGTPRHCGLMEFCKNPCSNTCISSNVRKCGHADSFEKRNITACNPVTPCLPYTREGRSGSNDIAPTTVVCCTPNKQVCGPGRCGVYDVVSVYTSEGTPRHCGLMEFCKNPCSNTCASLNRRKSEHADSSEKRNIAACNPVTPCLPYTREGRSGSNDIALTTVGCCTLNKQVCGPGRCGVYDVVSVYTSEGTPRHCGLMEFCKNPCSNTCASLNGRKCGHSNSSEKSNIAACNPVASCFPYAREGRQGPNNVCSKAPIMLASSNPDTQECGPGRCGVYNIVCVYTGDGEPKHCGLIEICKNPCMRPLISSTCGREGKFGPCGTSATVRSFLPYTHEGKPGPFSVSEMRNNTTSKQVTPYTREGKPGPFGIIQENNIIATKDSVPYTQEGRPGPFDIYKINNNTASEQITPYTREGKPGPFCIIEKNNTLPTKQIGPLPYTREGRPGPFDIYEMSNNTASEQITPYTREGKPGPFGNIEKNNTLPTKYSGPVPYTREGRPGPFDIYEMSNNTASEQVTPYTREGKPGPFGNIEKNNTLPTKYSGPVPYTREGRPGPFDISEMNNNTASEQVTPYTRKKKPGPFNISEATNTTTIKGIIPVPYTREGKPWPFDISESNTVTSTLDKSSLPYTREGTPRPCGIFEASNRTSTKQIDKKGTTPKPTKSSAPYTRESVPRSCGMSEPSSMNNSFLSYSEPCEVYSFICGFTREGKSGHCCNMKMNDASTPIPVTSPAPYTREGKPGPFSISEINVIATYKQLEPIPYTREGSPGPFNISDTSCCRPYIRESKPGPCDILDENNKTCPKHPTSYTPCRRTDCNITQSNQLEPMPYTREGKPGPFDIFKTISDDLTTTTTPRVYTREGRPGPLRLSEISDVTPNKDIPDTTYYNVFMATTNPCQCGFNAPSTDKKASNSGTSEKSDQSCIEVEYKKHTKKLRYTECDGTIVDEKRITIIKIKKRKPPKQDAIEANKSTCISQNLEGGTDLECKCCKQSKSENIRSSPDVMPCPKMRTSISTQILKTECCDDKKSEDQANSPKCDCSDKEPPPPIPCPDKPNDSASGQECKRGDKGPKCSCGEKAPEPPPVCANRLEDSASGPKCDCGEKSSEPPPLVCANRLEDSASGSKCHCGDNSSEPPSLVCANRLEDSASGPKCDCGNKAPPKPPPLVCANRLEDSASGPKCDCGNKAPPKPPPLVCANRLEDSASGPKCDCGAGAPKSPSQVCANRLEDSASGPKCDCGEQTSKPPSLVCANRLEDSASGPKCDCGAPLKPPPAPCPNKPKESASASKCSCGGGNKPKNSNSSCGKVVDLTGPKCSCGEGNMPKNSNSSSGKVVELTGPKCSCGGGAPPKPPPIPCPNKPKDSASGTKCKCGDEGPKCKCGDKAPSDSSSGTKCSCGGGTPPPIPCPNKPKDSADGTKCKCGDDSPKCKCGDKALPDSASSQKCNCGGGTPPPISCPNKPNDTASTPKCSCGGGAASKKSSSIECPNKPKKSASGPKCSCGEGAASKKSFANNSPNKPKDSGSSPMCSCGKKGPDSGSGPKCLCGGGTASKKSSSIECPNKPKKSAIGPNCSCGGGAASKKPPAIECPDKPKDSVNSPNCSCGAPPDSANGPKCDCGGGASKKPSAIECPNKSKDSANGPKCSCGAPPDSGPKCECGGGNKPENSDSSRGQVVDLTGPKCECGDRATSKSSKKPKDAQTCCNSGSKTSHVSKKNSKTGTDAKCECSEEAPPKPKSTGGGEAPANTCVGGNKVEETCQTDVPDYPLCACTGEALSKALLQKVLNTLRCQNSPFICAPPEKPNRHANCFTDSSPSGPNQKKSCALCGSPIANKETRPPPAKATCVCSDSSVHAPKGTKSKSKTNKNTTCGYCTFKSLAQNSNAPSKKTCEIDNKNYRSCNLTREKNDPVTKLCTSTSTSKKNNDDSFCTIKIVTKSQKSRCCGTEYQSSLAFTATNALEALRQLCRSPVQKKNKNICRTCYSPDSIASDIQEKPCHLCEYCQDKLIQENERDYRCTTYGVESASCRSGSPERSLYRQKTNSSTRGCGNNCKK